MMFSIIMPSRISEYANCAKNRREKLKRALDSVFAQTFTDFELIVIADGCEETVEIVKQFAVDNKTYLAGDRIRLFKVDKIGGWPCGALRNIGLRKAEGNYIVYLDSDDYFGVNHLKSINDNLKENEWIFFNDYKPDQRGEFVEDLTCKIRHGYCGTSNICHKNTPLVYWLEEARYGFEDYSFIQILKGKLPNYTQTSAGQYNVCHVPKRYDV